MNDSAPIGCRRWAIAEGYVPSDDSTQADRRFVSHETACILNARDSPANVSIRIYFADRSNG